MCGIVAMLGRGPVAGSILDALKRLEYRGYDSAGIATLEAGRLTRRRASGKLKNLELRLAAEPLSGRIGIGHTRWATHGRPSDNNAHPHVSANVGVVHNGIIENFRELRGELQAKGHEFSTETDSEVVAHLVSETMRGGLAPVDAVASSLPRLRGAFALALIFDGEEDLLIGASSGAPLAVGFGEGEHAGEMFLGSDALALGPFTGTIAYLEEERVAKSKTWPDSPRALAGRLRRAAPFLRKIGIEISFGREGRARTRTIHIAATPTPEHTGARPSAPSASAPKSNPANGFLAPPLRTAANDADGSSRGGAPTVRANPLKTNAATGADGADANPPLQSAPEKAGAPGWRARL
jgi:hypothetical protein